MVSQYNHRHQGHIWIGNDILNLAGIYGGGVAILPNIFSHPVIASAGGKYEDHQGNGGSKYATVSIFYLDDNLQPNSFIYKNLHSLPENTQHPFVGQLGDDFIVAAPESKKIYSWNNLDERWYDTGNTLDKKREFGMSVKTSTRWFPDCRGESQFEKKFSSCLDAMKTGGMIPKSGQTLTLLMDDDATRDCTNEDIYETGTSCPKFWYGKAADEFCFAVDTIPRDNEEAARSAFK